MAFKVLNADWNQDKHKLTRIREKVFVCEWRIPRDKEFDKHDGDAFHVLAVDDKGSDIATARLTREGEVGRIAVMPGRREPEVYQQLMGALVDIAKQQAIGNISVQCELEGVNYFQQQGFRPVGAVFMDAGIPRQKMVCPVSNFCLAKVDMTH